MPSYAEYASRREIMSNDMSMMLFFMRTLVGVYRTPKLPVDMSEFSKLYSESNWEGLLHTVQKHFGIMPVPIELVERPLLRDTPARVVWDTHLQDALATDMKRCAQALRLVKTYISSAPFCVVLAIMAHESARILLEDTRHPLRFGEKFINITAIHFGFQECIRQSIKYRLDNDTYTRYFSGGSLTETEHAYAARHLGYQPIY